MMDHFGRQKWRPQGKYHDDTNQPDAATGKIDHYSEVP